MISTTLLSIHITYLKKKMGLPLRLLGRCIKHTVTKLKFLYPFAQRIFKEELKNYFLEYRDRFNLDDGTRVRSYYVGFRSDKFGEQSTDVDEPIKPKTY